MPEKNTNLLRLRTQVCAVYYCHKYCYNIANIFSVEDMKQELKALDELITKEREHMNTLKIERDLLREQASELICKQGTKLL